MSDNESRIAVLESRIVSLEKRIDKMENRGNYVVMAVIGGVITTVLKSVGVIQ